MYYSYSALSALRLQLKQTSLFTVSGALEARYTNLNVCSIQCLTRKTGARTELLLAGLPGTLQVLPVTSFISVGISRLIKYNNRRRQRQILFFYKSRNKDLLYSVTIFLVFCLYQIVT